ncbi:hypothetical protein [Haliangium ochraceum]|uniref:Uncharacterized protein n=1 Tax=Haliangium ochraceum (strain DSM 14365 / JCM 11303 / SMP-2) TaxID=502025 RepID=D0LMY2_HALO1|nr:hypothetical protein [Haliangium ochraceum]ACY13353.1 hypothetical protein Hoch_0727 [Haliangium ochraceum DSM 14365]
MPARDADRARLIAQVRQEIARASGRRYELALDALDATSLWELCRLLRDLDAEKQTAIRRVQRTPWRR